MNNDRIWILLTRKLSGEASLTELQELELLLSHQPQSGEAVKNVSAWWAIDETKDTEFMEATYLLHLQRMKEKGVPLNTDEPVLQEAAVFNEPAKKTSPFPKIAIAVMVMLLFFSTWFFFKTEKNIAFKKPMVSSEEVLTHNGSRTKILLPDGSNVWLNSGSKLNYGKNFETGKREVYLSGEAFFDVVKNPLRPFIIHTAAIDVKVLGTRFNVKAYADDKTTETSLIRGSVEVYLKNNPSKKYVLKPDEKLVLLNEVLKEKIKPNKISTIAVQPVVQIKALTYLKNSETDIETSWTKNILSFEDEEFAEVAKKMERWYDASFEFRNKQLEQQYLSGSFEKESLEQAMKALKFSTGFNFKIEGKKILIY